MDISCLTQETIVNVVQDGGNNYYRFNGDTTFNNNIRYGLNNGTYTFKNVSSSHPIAILNSGVSTLISYTGSSSSGTKTVDGNSYTFYHGDVTVTVSGDFGSVSVYCYYHGYMGGYKLLVYSNTCSAS